MPEPATGGWRLLGVFVALAAALIWITTINGAGLQPDSIHYIRTARALGGGESVFAISKHWPPLYPLLLSWFSPEVGAELVTARWLAMLSFVTAIAGLGACLLQALRGVNANHLIACVLLLVMFSPGFTRANWVALTEGPFIAVLMWGLYATLLLAERYRVGALALLCTCIALMLLLRYSAAPFVLALAMTLGYIALDWNWKQRLTALAGLLSGVLPLLLWTLLHESSGAPRSFNYHPPNEGHWLQLADTMGAWLGGLPATITYVLLPVSLVAAAFAWWKHRSPALLFCLLIIPGYLTFLFLSISFMDAHTPLDTRILAPLFPFWVMMFALTVPALVSEEAGRAARLAAAVVLIMVTAVGAPLFARQAEPAILYGVVFADRRAPVQPIITYAAALEDGRAIYTNYNEWLYLFYNRDAQLLPHLFNPVNNTLNPALDEDMDAMLADLAATNGVVIWVDFIKGRRYLPNVEFMTNQLGLEVTQELQGGKVLELRNRAPGAEPQTAEPAERSALLP